MHILLKIKFCQKSSFFLTLTPSRMLRIVWSSQCSSLGSILFLWFSKRRKVCSQFENRSERKKENDWSICMLWFWDFQMDQVPYLVLTLASRHRCSISGLRPAHTDPIPDIGTFRCPEYSEISGLFSKPVTANWASLFRPSSEQICPEYGQRFCIILSTIVWFREYGQ